MSATAAAKVPVITFSNGQTCPAVGLGTWKSLPGEVSGAVKAAIDAGYRHIDCAYVYNNEQEVGDALKDKFQQGVVTRKEMFITSKLWNTFHRPDLVERALKVSLQRLGLDYLDLYLIHFPQAYKEGEDLMPKDASGNFIPSPVDFVDTWRAMEECHRRGLVRSIGVSNFNRRQIERLIAHAEVKPHNVQIEVHPYLNNAALIEYCRSEGIAVTAYSPLGSPDRPWAKPGEPSLLVDERVNVVAKKYGKSVPQVLIRYALDRGLIVIPKSVTPARIQQNIDVLDIKLTDQDIQQIAKLECGARFCTLSDVNHPDYPFYDEY